LTSRRAVSRIAELRAALREPLLVALTTLIACALFIVAPLHAADLVHSQLLGAVLMVVMLVAAFAVSDRPIPALLVATAVALAGAAAVLRLSGASRTHVYLDAAAWLLLGFGLIWVVARVVFAPGRVSYHRVVGAVLIYLMIGMTFVALYALAGLELPNAFTGLSIASDRQGLLSELIYFSFVTLTSVGYGDILPAHPLVRGIANLEATLGQLFPATLLARLVSLEIAHSGRDKG
jgi:Ion channel